MSTLSFLPVPAHCAAVEHVVVDDDVALVILEVAIAVVAVLEDHAVVASVGEEGPANHSNVIENLRGVLNWNQGYLGVLFSCLADQICQLSVNKRKAIDLVTWIFLEPCAWRPIIPVIVK